MLNYTKLNNVTGWLTFFIAATVYTLTVEPTASYWDCGEFIATSYKLEVPHPPGAPFFLLTGRMFSLLAGDDVERVALMVNMLSVLSSAFTILFLFWSITHLAKKMVKEDGLWADLLVICSGLVGAMAYTFSDSFWFSAVEAEVYGMSSFFTAFVVWAMLKWENLKDPAQENRWFVLIAYMVGLSIGVHLLNLVTVPALGLIYYYKKRETVTVRGLISTMIVSLAIVLIILEGIIPGLPSVAGKFEINFVNTLGLPFGSGVILFVSMLLAYLVYGIYVTSKEERLTNLFFLVSTAGILFFLLNIVFGSNPVYMLLLAFVLTIGVHLGFGKDINKTVIITLFGVLPGIVVWYLFFEGTSREKAVEQLSASGVNTVILSLTFILIGYSSYSIVLIRSIHNPPIDENNPEDVLSYVSYLKREQYGSRPLVHGQYFTAQLIDQKKGEAVYTMGEDKYEITDYKLDYVYDPKHTTILPRMYSSQPGHVKRYREIMGLKKGEKPSWLDNIGYMFKHQLGTMYFRYFMWNFAGRESDIQGAGWVGLADAFKKVPSGIDENKGRNIFFMIPLLVGLAGLIFQYYNDLKNFSFVGLLFILTGAALIVYLNSPPVEPRERDYIYAGSYYAFAFWIGLGVIALYNGLSRFLGKGLVAVLTATLICGAAPAIMAAEGWDDHDRSDRYFSVDSAKNFLASCEENAIIFTGGDNDTFPLWYVQEVEGFRTDVRVIVLSYFNTDWYIEQMMRQAYKSDPLPFGLTLKNYQQGGLNDYLPFAEQKIKAGQMNASQYIDLIKQEHPALQIPTSISKYNSVPTKKFYLPVDTANVLDLGIIPEQHRDKLVDRMTWSMKGRGLEKKDLAILDLIVTNNWGRPIYFNNTSASSVNFNLRRYMVQEGNAFRLLPVRNSENEMLIDTDKMYENMMEGFHWRELDNPEVYYSEDYRNFVLNHRASFNTLIQALILEGKMEKALNAVNRCLEVMPDDVIRYDHFSVQQVGYLLMLEEHERAAQMAELIADRSDEMLDYLFENNINDQFELQKNLISLSELARAFRATDNGELATKFENMFRKYYGQVE